MYLRRSYGVIIGAALMVSCRGQTGRPAAPRAGAPAPSAQAQAPTGPLSRQAALDAVRPLIDCCEPEEERRRVLADSAALALYADLLLGRAPMPSTVDSNRMLSYLISSRNPRFVPIYLRLADPRHAVRTLPDGYRSTAFPFWNAVLGLGRHLEVPAARARLWALSRARDPLIRTVVAGALLSSPDSALAREFLRQLPLASVPAGMRARVDSALGRTAAP